ncbi:MAG: DUF885 domain-containing protein [Rubricoccaceae bacterium]
MLMPSRLRNRTATRGIRLLALLLALLTTAQPAAAQPAAPTPSAALAALMDEHWAWTLRDNPLFATSVGEHAYNDRLPEVGVAAALRRADAQRAFLARLRQIDRAALSDEERLNADILERQLRDAIAEVDLMGFVVPITNRGGFHVSFPELGERVPLRTVQDYENYVARLRGFRAYAEGHVELLTLGAETAVTLPAVVLQDFEALVRPHIVADPTQSRLYAPFTRFPEAIPAEDRARLEAAGRAAIAEVVVPGYADFLHFMQTTYIPLARGSIGAFERPGGEAYYAHRVRHFTTLDDATPESVHQTGLAEVARIRAEMDAVIARTGFEGSFQDFLAFLRTDDRFYVDTPEELLRRVAEVGKKIDGELPRLFRTLPRMPWGIRPVPDFIAPRTTTAYYQRPAGDGTQAGFYYVNTYDLRSRPLYELEALSLHEAVPGHHLQIALQQEIADLPPLRRYAGFTAFVEGWALYAERLGLEVGFYEDPYSDFGRLTYEMWRALRLVVDTGIHQFGWSRQRAIDYMAENSGLSLLNITNEVDRYIAWPGQALAYKTGELKIRELRARAEAALGDRFDVRAFHDAVLLAGAVPLSVLEQRIDAWIAAGGP